MLRSGWCYEGTDLVDVPLDISSGQLNGIVVLLSKSMPRLKGTMLDDASAPAEGSVILFPEDRSRWSNGPS